MPGLKLCRRPASRGSNECDEFVKDCVATQQNRSRAGSLESFKDRLPPQRIEAHVFGSCIALW
jgi:hypothetical protein